jgi:hypothetical protein
MLLFVINGFVVSRSLHRNRWFAWEFMVKRFSPNVGARHVRRCGLGELVFPLAASMVWPFGHVKGSTIAINALMGLIRGQA